MDEETQSLLPASSEARSAETVAPEPSSPTTSASSQLSFDPKIIQSRVQNENSLKEPGVRQRSETNEIHSQTWRDQSQLFRADHSISDFQAFMHLIKGNVGTGILGLPKAVSQAGIVLGPVCLALMALMSTVCMTLLVTCSHELSKRAGVAALDYAGVAEESARQYSRKLAVISRRAVNVFLLITQLGFCCVYFLFIADNVVQILEACGVVFPFDDTKAAQAILPIIMIPMIVCSYIRNLDSLAVFSTIANVASLLGLAVIYYYMLSNHHTSEKLHLFAEPAGWPLFFGTAVYAFEGIGVVLPLENKMKNPTHFKGVLVVGMLVVVSLYLTMGALGYWSFGTTVLGSITLNLPCNKNSDWIYSLVKLFYAGAIFLSYLLQFYVPANIIEMAFGWTRVGQREWSRGACVRSYVLRTFLVMVTCVLAIVIPKLGLFISLVGSVSSSALALIFPPILYYLTFRNTHHRSSSKAKCCQIVIFFSLGAISVIGILGFGFGTYASLKGIIHGSNSTSSGAHCHSPQHAQTSFL